MSDPPPRPPPSRRRRAVRVALGAFALVALALAGTIAFLLSEAGLPFIAARVIEQSGGRLSIVDPSGSVASRMRFARLEWRGAETTVAARNVVVEWSLFALFSRRLAIQGLGAAELSIAMKPADGAAAPPETLALPLAVDIGHIAVARLDWQAGPRGGSITGLQFGYAGDAAAHRIRSLRFASDYGTLTADATLAATKPFALEGRATLSGDGPLEHLRFAATLGGTLAEIEIGGKGAFRESPIEARVALAPFAADALRTAAATVADVDLAALRDGWPRTRLTLTIDAQPRPGAAEWYGAFRAANADPGRIDDDRVPIGEAAGRYVYAGDTLALSELTIALAGGAQASGEATIDVGASGVPSRWRLDVRELDLARLHSALAATRLTGSLTADVAQARQSLAGELAQPGLSVAFSATYADRRLEVAQLRAQADGGTLTGSGRIALDAPRAFDVALAAQRFDPSRFAALPAGALSGTVKASGTLLPQWRVTADVALVQGSRLAGVAVAGKARGTATRHTLANAEVDATAGSAKLTASGGAGAVGDRLAFALNAPRLAELAPLLPRRIGALAGSLVARGTAQIEPGGAGGDVDLRAERLAIGSGVSADRLEAKASFAPGGSAASPQPLDGRRLALDLTATKAAIGQVELSSVRFAAQGSLASHEATLAAKNEAFDIAARLAGGLSGASDPAAMGAARWKGRLVSFASRGDVALSLTAPAALEFGAGHLQIAAARIAIADGRADIEQLDWTEGRLTTRGSFAGVPLASVAALAGEPLPIVSTLMLAGEWSVSATPRLAGSFAVRRESGDLYGVAAGGTRMPELAFGVEDFELSGSLAGDALDAKLAFRSRRAGEAQGAVRLAAVEGAEPGRIAKNAPLTASLDADLASLAPLQPWIGTAAVIDGRARIALTAVGTLDAPALRGSVAGDAIRVDAPQFGVYLRDGRVRASLADGEIAVEEIAFSGGDGSFTASGIVGARRAAQGQPRTRLAWKAENFRVTNRPDLRLVVAGDGTLSIVDRRLAIAGTVAIVEGQIEWQSAPPGQLGPDVVVEGRPPPRQDTIADLPLTLDVEVNFGSRLRFQGAGLDTTLGGSVRVRTAQNGRLEGRGSIVTTQGTYYAFGQRLTIDRGRLIFDGPLDNPALDIVALRKNLQVEAGVEVSGTARVPRVRITSNPPVPENEALAWLITGQGLSGSRGDFAAISAASAALLSQNGRPLTADIAETLGLDDITVRGGSVGSAGGAAGGTAGTTGQVIVFGKRLTDRLTIGYEQGLSIAANALRIEYALTRTLTLRAEAGVVSGVGIVYRRTFD